jgi:flavin reductase (DIM6/NTAB) family NADH-FMN oxidoreductase RutF
MRLACGSLPARDLLSIACPARLGLFKSRSNRECTMEYAPHDLSPRERYKVLTGFVLPRPIAWVTTIGPTGVVNAAPFSFFNVFCEDPPLCMFASNLRPDGRVKDTVINIERSGVFVVNLADEPLARAMHDSSGDFPPEIGEPDYLGLKLAPSTKVVVPRLADAPWAMECKTWKRIDINNRQLFMGEGIHFHIRDDLWDREAMRVHMDRYHPVGRMFADRYCRTDDRIEFPAAPVVAGT